MNRESIKILIGGFIAAAITWFLNHRMGLGPIIANGIVGVMVSLFLSPKLAGAYYVASFVGMSSMAIIPSMLVAGFAGLLASLVIMFSKDIYGGIGGKGGTIASISTLVTMGFIYLFIR